jgi:putative ABC transport system permease protein
VTPDFFSLLGIPLLSGTTCRISFDPKTQLTVLVSRSFADRYFPGQSPLGHYLREGDFPAQLQIAGVTSDIRKQGYARDPQPTVYWCGMLYHADPEFILKSAGDPLRLSEAVRQRMHVIEPNRAVYDVKRLSDYVSSTLTERRFQMVLLTSFAAMALLLAAIGLYGVTSFLVSLRTREIGLRAALGASPWRIFVQILWEGAFMTGAGVLFGIVAALALSRSIASLLFGVASTDPVTFVAVPLVLACVSAVALWLPARRATNIDPMEALRQD